MTTTCPLIVASLRGYPEIVSYLIDEVGVDINSVNYQGDNFLMSAKDHVLPICRKVVEEHSNFDLF